VFSNRRLHKLENGQARNKPQGLNYIVFERNCKPLIGESGFIRITTTSKEDGTNVPHGLLKPDQPLVIKQAGYVYIYLSKESDTPVQVFLDDFKVEHIKSPVVQMDDYYPFGLTYNSYSRENSSSQDYKFNGKEWLDELNLGWQDYGWRMYDPQIGRWREIVNTQKIISHGLRFITVRIIQSGSLSWMVWITTILKMGFTWDKMIKRARMYIQ
jgi:RHS repeat-associated protein